jgi:hypothetical protein
MARRNPQRHANVRKTTQRWLAVSAMAASVGLISVAVKGPALLGPLAGGRDTTTGAAHSNRERAIQDRKNASLACAKHLIAECEANLDKARAIDPTGEDAGDVRALRVFIAEANQDKARSSGGGHE